MPETIEFRIGDVKTTALVALPKGDGPFPGAVVSFHNLGLDGETADMVDRVAAAGFGVIAPNHYHVLPAGVDIEQRRDYLTDHQYEKDFRAAAAWLGTRKSIDGSRLAVLGHCAGGRSTWVALECCPDLWRCGCVWYGGGAFGALGEIASPYERLNLITCPVIGFFGNEDKNPSPADVDKFDAELTRLGKPHEFYRYDGAGHAFTNSREHQYAPRETEDSWAKALAFMRRHCA
jgi:carboxymethylenebutenolidase